MKKSFLLFILLLVSTVNSFGEVVTIDGINYGLYNNSAGVCSGGNYFGDIVIPDKITYNNQEYPVTSIEDGAFARCENLTSIFIPYSVKHIFLNPFQGCSGLRSIVVDSGNEIYDSRNNCNAIINTKNNRLLGGCQSTIIPDDITSIGEGAFLGCTALKSIDIPNSVTSIGVRAFLGCTALESIDIPNGVTSIGNGAFSGCTALESINIPNSVTSIGGSAFSGCTALESIDIPNGVSEIYDYTFSDCSFLKSISIPNTVVTIGNCAFQNCTALESVVIPTGVTTIGDNTFQNCTDLESVIIPTGVTTIGFNAFQNCTALESVIIPTGVTTIGFNAFENCTALESLYISNTVSQIRNYAFNNCIGLKSIIVESGNEIYDSRNNCNAIIETKNNKLLTGCQNTIIPNSVTTIGFNAFQNCSLLKSIIIPMSVVEIEHDAFSGCTGLTSIIVDSENRVYDSRGNCNAIIETNNNKLVVGCKTTIIPNNVTSIGEDSFYNISDLKSISIPYSVTNIFGGAFYGCRLESIRATNPITYIMSGFSTATQSRAIVYIPVGTWSSFVYDGGWGLFNNLKETAVAQHEISRASAYTLMNAKDYSYAVYDAINDRVAIMPSHGSVDESNAYHSWQLVKMDNGYSIYNLGARKYLKINSDGSMALQTSPVIINMVDRSNGIELGADKTARWNFVLNSNMYADINLAGIDATIIDNDDAPSTYYSLDGQKIVQPRKGMNIIKSANGQTRKVVLK